MIYPVVKGVLEFMSAGRDAASGDRGGRGGRAALRGSVNIWAVQVFKKRYIRVS